MTDRVLFDTAIFVYAVGADHRYRDPCRLLLGATVAGQLNGQAAVIAAQELMRQRARRTGDRAEAANAARAVLSLCTMHDLTLDDLELATALFEEHDTLDAADACHAAVAINQDIDLVVSPDPAFDGIRAIRRLDPIEAAEQYAG